MTQEPEVGLSTRAWSSRRRRSARSSRSCRARRVCCTSRRCRRAARNARRTSSRRATRAREAAVDRREGQDAAVAQGGDGRGGCGRGGRRRVTDRFAARSCRRAGRPDAKRCRAPLGIARRLGPGRLGDEAPEEMGVSHLLEHMVFKGTHRRGARELALVLERLGGSLDAYTTREHTSLPGARARQDIATGLDVLADLVLDPRCGRRTWSWSGRSCWRRSRRSRTRPMTWSSTSTRNCCGASTPTATASWARATRWRAHGRGPAAVHAARYRRGNLVVAVRAMST
jgi:hypothetical protein